MTRRDQIHKWFVYALGLLPVWILDEFILTRIPLLGVVPMLLPIAVVAVAVQEGALAGAGSLLIDLGGHHGTDSGFQVIAGQAQVGPGFQEDAL